jgi:mono/diheme cytochrome c family protein
MKRMGSLAAAGLALVLGAATLHAQAAPAADGAQLFARSCASCHGAAGVPNPAMVRSLGAIPDFSDAHVMGALADSTMVNVVTNGKGRSMPAYKTRLTPDQVRAVVAYVRTLSHH